MGQAGVGKDFVVDVFTKKYGYSRVSFSDQLKKLAVKIYPWFERDYAPEVKEKPLNIIVAGELITKTPREIWLSLNKLRDIEDSMFVRMLGEEVALLNVPNIIVSDIRTQNEYDWCIANGYTVVAVLRKNIEHAENSFDDFVRWQISQGHYDYEYRNDINGTEAIETFIESCFEEVSRD